MAASVAVSRVRIRSGAEDALRTRLGVDRLLGAADVRASRLPPAAILLVDALADPLPGALDLRTATPGARWERAVDAALDAWAARAARPADGAVAAGAGAVVFADRAELLACLARDWCSGALADHWWWRTLRAASPPAALEAFAGAPEAVPAALARLAARGQATPWVLRLAPDQATRLLRLVAAATGAHAAAEAALVAGPPTRGRPAAGPGDDPWRAGSATARVSGPAPSAARGAAPWSGLRGAGAADVARLGPEQEALLGVALALARGPLEVRAPAFVAAARAWRATWRPDAARRSGAPGAAPAPAVAAATERSAAGGPAAGAPPPSRVHAPAPARQRDHGVPGATSVPAASLPGAPARPPPPRTVPRTRPAPGTVAPTAMPAPASPEQAEEPAPPLATSVHTRLGGLFHLVHIAQRLGLYGDFSEPRRPGLALPVWDLVALLGARLLRATPRDPVWALLATLAGRDPGTAAGRGYRPPRAWRAPAGWLEPFPAEGIWRHEVREGRLVIAHPAGFIAVDVRGGDLARELRRLGAPRAAPARRPLVAGRPPARDRWLGHLAAYVRARLALALGAPPARAAALALRRPAAVLVTDTRVDVVSDLADLPIEVRVAGLDRDPGYVPAAGLSLFFHFR